MGVDSVDVLCFMQSFKDAESLKETLPYPRTFKLSIFSMYLDDKGKDRW